MVCGCDVVRGGEDCPLVCRCRRPAPLPGPPQLPRPAGFLVPCSPGCPAEGQARRAELHWGTARGQLG
eukprot:11731960-Alexandrium_andersonii.AAC.1